ncbi:MAG: hypothetical protein ACUVUR_06385 [bacterium]
MRCPHCGEPIVKGQERCFACGERIRVRRLYQKLPVDYRIIITAGALILIGLGGIFILHLGKKSQAPSKAWTSPTKPGRQIQDSLRRVKALTQETLRIQPGSEEINRARGQLERLKGRYEKVKSQVLGETPTPQQRELMNQIQRELAVMQSRAGELSTAITAERKKELTRELSELERRINNLISDFARAPKSR